MAKKKATKKRSPAKGQPAEKAIGRKTDTGGMKPKDKEPKGSYKYAPKLRALAAKTEERRVEVARLYCDGVPQKTIAEMFGISIQMVSKDLKDIRKSWRDAKLESYNQMIENELEKIDALEQEAMHGWGRSRLDSESLEHKMAGVDDDGEVVWEMIKKTTKGRAGDSRFLDVIGRCIERRCKLLGLDAPERFTMDGEIEMRVVGDDNWYGKSASRSEKQLRKANLLPPTE